MSEQYDKIADQFVQSKTEFFNKDKDLAREFILAHLQDTAGKTLLDIGCGAGPDVAVYEQMPFATVCGVDPSAKMIDKAKEVVAHPDNVSVGSFEHTAAVDSSVDYAVSRFALHYVKDTAVAYQEVARILRPGGKLIFVVDHPIASAVTGTFFDKEGLRYVRITIYGNVQIEFPHKNFTDYFCPTFLELFEIEEIKEWCGADGEYQDGPNALAFVACKK